MKLINSQRAVMSVLSVCLPIYITFNYATVLENGLTNWAPWGFVQFVNIGLQEDLIREKIQDP